MTLKGVSVGEYTFHIPPPCLEDIEIIYTDDDLLVVNKPAGLLSVPGRIMKDCVLNRLKGDYPEVVIVHRLDLDTSGLLVLSRSRLATSDLNRQFRERAITKQYIAVVDGMLEQDEGEIMLPIAPDPVNRPRQLIDHVNGKSAHTRDQVIERSKSRRPGKQPILSTIGNTRPLSSGSRSQVLQIMRIHLVLQGNFVS